MCDIQTKSLLYWNTTESILEKDKDDKKQEKRICDLILYRILFYLLLCFDIYTLQCPFISVT